MNEHQQARQPDYHFAAMDKDRDDKAMSGRIGVAWKQPDGSIRIKMNPFVVLDAAKNNLVLTLFPADFHEQRETGGKKNKTSEPIPTETHDDPIPY